MILYLMCIRTCTLYSTEYFCTLVHGWISLLKITRYAVVILIVETRLWISEPLSTLSNCFET